MYILQFPPDVATVAIPIYHWLRDPCQLEISESYTVSIDVDDLKASKPDKRSELEHVPSLTQREKTTNAEEVISPW